MIRRDAEETLAKLSLYYPVITITGPRQSGKTTLAKAFFQNANYVNLEEPSERKLAETDPKEFLHIHPAPIIIDEIQRVPALLSSIQVDVDSHPGKARYILTGSNQPLLREGISQSLAGRTGLLQLLPLSIHELIQANLSFDRDEYLFNGFYPRLYSDHIPPEFLYRDYFATYVERDVNLLLRIADRSKFDLFVRLLAGRVGQLLNLHSLSDDIGVSSQTLSTWLSVLEASFLVFRLPCYFQNFGKRLLKTPKLYFTDVGLAASLLGIHSPQQIAQHPLLGSLFENLVVLEALKTRLNKGQTPDLYFFRDQRGYEVDLLTPKNGQLLPIEIKACRSFDASLTSSIRKFSSIDPSSLTPVLIYAGSLNPSLQSARFCPYQDTYTLF